VRAGGLHFDEFDERAADQRYLLARFGDVGMQHMRRDFIQQGPRASGGHAGNDEFGLAPGGEPDGVGKWRV